jgi:heptosyltransferase-1
VSDAALRAGRNNLKILIVRVGAMGDVLHGMPAVAGLRATLPGCEIGWAIEPRWMPLLRGQDGTSPLVDRVHPVRTREWQRRILSPRTVQQIASLRRELREPEYDVCVDLQGSLKSAAVGWMAGALRFVGLDRPRERQARLLYGERVAVTEASVIEQACELVGAGIGRTVMAGLVELPVEREAEHWCDRLLKGIARFVVVAPTAGWGSKEWGAERYAALGKYLEATGLAVLVNAAPGAVSPVATTIAERSGATIAPSTLAQMIALTRRASLVIGGDTGPVHLAAALGRPVVALFGPTDPARNGPAFPGARVTVLRHPDSVTDHRRHAGTDAGLARIRVEEVLAAALAMLAEAGDA